MWNNHADYMYKYLLIFFYTFKVVIFFSSCSTGSPSHLSVGEQQDMVHDPYEFLQSPETSNATSN